jgi:hypothetical protein
MASSDWMRRKREKEYLGKEVGPKGVLGTTNNPIL